MKNGRIWYSDALYSRCGFYSRCAMLRKYENELRTVNLDFIRQGKIRVVEDSEDAYARLICLAWADLNADGSF